MYERFTHQRCAFYWVPAPGSEEHRLLTPLLGRDILTGEAVPQIVPEGLTSASWADMTETAAHYGVHATLKAPFETKPGVTDDELREAGRRIAGPSAQRLLNSATSRPAEVFWPSRRRKRTPPFRPWSAPA